MSDFTPTSSIIPVTILAGFLGSGKTTLLNRILREEHGLRLAVLVNDFGKVNIDAELLDGDGVSNMVSLPNGCICCTLFGSLVEVLSQLVHLPEPPQHILIEASGVSQPHQVADIVFAGDFQQHMRLDGIITLVDALNVRRLAEVVMFIEKQLEDADLILLNKLDLVGPDEKEELIAWIHGIAPNARVIPTTYADVPLDILLSIDREPVFDARPHDAHVHLHVHHDHDHHHDHDGHVHEHSDEHTYAYETWMATTEQPLRREALLAALSELPPEIYRGKGFVYLADAPARKGILQMVGPRVSLDESDGWGDDPARTELVFIGAPGALSDDQLHDLLTACVAESSVVQ